MAGITTLEGRNLINNLLLLGSDVDRGTGLYIGLMLNTSVGVGAVMGDIVTPTGGGYVDKLITGTWLPSNAGATRTLDSEVLFIPVGGPFIGDIAGYFIRSSGTVPRLIFAEVAQGIPYEVVEGDVYGIRVKLDLVGA